MNNEDEIKNNNVDEPQDVSSQPASSTSDAADADTVATELAQCQKERDEYLGAWQRARADFSNYKKDEMLRLQEMARYSASELIQEVLRVLDNFSLAIAAMEKAGSNQNKAGGIDKGIYMIRAQIEDMLKRYGVTKVPIAPGDAFNPAVAEAITEVASDIEAGNIVEEVEAGYFLHDKLLRPARVKISKGKEI